MAGTLTITGAYSQSSGGTLTVEIGGATAGTFDQLHVGGAASLAGTLNINEIVPFTAAGGQSFQVMSFGSKSGDFATYNGLNPASGASFNPSFSSTALTLNAVTTFTVTNTNDSGAGSLRQAILDANTHAGLDKITFNIAGSGVHTIAPLSALPTSPTRSLSTGRARRVCGDAAHRAARRQRRWGGERADGHGWPQHYPGVCHRPLRRSAIDVIGATADDDLIAGN